MKDEAVPAVKKAGLIPDALDIYKEETGQSLGAWALVAILNLIAQIVFRHEMKPGEFGTLNTSLGAIGLMAVPVLALHRAFTHYLARRHAEGQRARIDTLRVSALVATETFGWLWGGLCLALVFLLLPLLELPRFSLQLFTLMNVLVAVGGLISCAVCERGQRQRLRLWTALLLFAAGARVLAGAGLVWAEPWAESGLAAFLLAGFITLTPALEVRESGAGARWQACRAMWDKDFLLCASSTFSVLLALYLFTNADRIVTQSWFGVVTNNNLGLINWPMFDSYQTAGLLARSVLWGTQPLLWIHFAQRARVEHSRAASLTFFWIYLGALVLGALVLGVLAKPLSELFCGARFQTTAMLLPSLAAAMLPLGLLQGLGIFALASRRPPECFVLAACAIGYTVLLFLAGRQPLLMPAYMFGGGLVSTMIVLFVGVVRWGRKQP
jgi:hypothetical protein